MTANDTLVSIIIPAYNCAEYLPAAIESCLNQTYSPIEVIVVNDGSPDSTDQVVQPYLDKLVYITQPNRGLSAARNVGFYRSNGQFINFLDADDVLDPEKIDRQIAEFDRNPALDVVLCNWIDINCAGEQIRRNSRKYREYGLRQLLNWEVFPAHAALIRRQALIKTGLFDESIPVYLSQEDWHLWLRLAFNNCSFRWLPEYLISYRKRNGSISCDFEKHLKGVEHIIEMLQDINDPRVTSLHITTLQRMMYARLVAGRLTNGNVKDAADSLTEGCEKLGDTMLVSDTWNCIFNNLKVSGNISDGNHSPVSSILTELFKSLPDHVRRASATNCYFTAAENLQWSGNVIGGIWLLIKAIQINPTSAFSSRAVKLALRPFLPRVAGTKRYGNILIRRTIT